MKIKEIEVSGYFGLKANLGNYETSDLSSGLKMTIEINEDENAEEIYNEQFDKIIKLAQTNVTKKLGEFVKEKKTK